MSKKASRRELKLRSKVIHDQRYRCEMWYFEDKKL